jgi:hypothetical protein
VEQEPLTLRKHLDLPRVFNGIQVAQFIIFGFCRPLFVLFRFLLFFLKTMESFDLQLLIAPLVFFKIFLMVMSWRFSQFSGCRLIFSVYIIMSFDFPFARLFEVRQFCYYLWLPLPWKPDRSNQILQFCSCLSCKLKC